MVSFEHDGRFLAKVDHLIVETEKKIDEKLALLDELTAQGEDTRQALRDFMSLVDALDKLAELKVSLTKQ